MRRLLALAAVACAACGDPTEDRAVEALGGEAPGVAPGPLHRPGQPCVTCHGASGVASGEFSVAGTVYLLLREDNPARNVQVRIKDITGDEVTAITNEAGNFYVRADEWRPVFPLQPSIRLGGLKKQMSTHIARAPSCADCHTSPPGPRSPGHIYIATSRAELTAAGVGP